MTLSYRLGISCQRGILRILNAAGFTRLMEYRQPLTQWGGNREPKIVTDMEERLTREQQKLMLLPEELKGKKFRIRKLTPKECFRLMGVDDADIDKMQETGISMTAQKKLAGNSIVVDVLFHLFRKMFVETEGKG